MTRNLRIAYIILGMGLAIAIALLSSNFATLSHQGSEIKSQEQELHSLVISQDANRLHNVFLWCENIDKIISYDSAYFNSSKAEALVQLSRLEKIVNDTNLSPQERSFATLFLQTEQVLYKGNTSINIHPYTLKQVPCKAIEQATAKSFKSKTAKH
jgi:hypothetical protein